MSNGSVMHLWWRQNINSSKAMMAECGPSDKICCSVCGVSCLRFGPMSHAVVVLPLWVHIILIFSRVWRLLLLYVCVVFCLMPFCCCFCFEFFCPIFYAEFFFFRTFWLNWVITRYSLPPRPTLWNTKQAVQHREHWRHLRISCNSPSPGTLATASVW